VKEGEMRADLLELVQDLGVAETHVSSVMETLIALAENYDEHKLKEQVDRMAEKHAQRCHKYNVQLGKALRVEAAARAVAENKEALSAMDRSAPGAWIRTELLVNLAKALEED
jgi:hypothetical protein